MIYEEETDSEPEEEESWYIETEEIEEPKIDKNNSAKKEKIVFLSI